MGKPTFDSRNSKTLVLVFDRETVTIQAVRSWISGYQEKV